MDREDYSFEEKIKMSQHIPKAKLNISVDAKPLEEFKTLLKKHFPKANLSQAMNEAMYDGLEELKKIDKGEES